MPFSADPPRLSLLPMYGRTCGNRSPVTCQLKCGSACAHEVPNQSGAPTFRDIATLQLSRRQVLVAGGALSAAAAIPGWLPEEAAAAPRAAKATLAFTPIAPVDPLVDDVTVPAGYDWKAILRWGDPLFRNSPAFDPAVPNAEPPGTPVRLQQRLPGHPGHRPSRPQGPAVLQSRVREPPDHVPALAVSPGVRGDQGDHRGGGDERRRTGAQRPRPALALHPGRSQEPPDHRGHAVPADRSRGR